VRKGLVLTAAVAFASIVALAVFWSKSRNRGSLEVPEVTPPVVHLPVKKEQAVREKRSEVSEVPSPNKERNDPDGEVVSGWLEQADDGMAVPNSVLMLSFADRELSATTDSAGRFEFRFQQRGIGMLRTRDPRLTIIGGGKEGLAVSLPSSNLHVKVTVKAGVFGRVVWANGTGVPSAKVWFTGNGSSSTAVTDNDGGFLVHVPLESWFHADFICVSDATETVFQRVICGRRLHSGDNVGEISLPALHDVLAYVTDQSSGTAVEGASVTYRDQSGNEIRAQTDSDGSVKLRLPEPVNAVTAVAGGFGRAPNTSHQLSRVSTSPWFRRQHFMCGGLDLERLGVLCLGGDNSLQGALITTARSMDRVISCGNHSGRTEVLRSIL